MHYIALPNIGRSSKHVVFWKFFVIRSFDFMIWTKICFKTEYGSILSCVLLHSHAHLQNLKDVQIGNFVNGTSKNTYVSNNSMAIYVNIYDKT